MDQLLNYYQAIDKKHKVPQRSLDCRPALDVLN